MDIKDYINTLSSEFESQAHKAIAVSQKAYMRDQFMFFGLKTDTRREIQKPFLNKEYLPNKEQVGELVKTIWEKPQRDFQLFAQELAGKYVKQFEKKDMELLEHMVTHKSWWDTVDLIAVKLMGGYFKKFPEDKAHYVNKWLKSGNIWLQRSALLFQLKYKKEIDPELLTIGINHLLGSKEFFINKAIGWVLREYSRTDPQWVVAFVSKTELSPLSNREALRLLDK